VSRAPRRRLPRVLALAVAVALASAARAAEDPWAVLRDEMVRTQIEARGVRDARVLAALRAVPRHRFVPEDVRHRAYEDSALPIGFGQTISQPYVVAAMTEALRPAAGDRVLEVGTGSGYQAAVLARLVEHVFTIEIVPELAESARRRLGALGVANVTVVTGDGFAGLPDESPFAGILVTAAPETVPPPLVEQLAVGGRLVIPVGTAFQELRVLTRGERGVESRTLFPVRFVPLVREPGRSGPPAR
jgi:protein-L-isoaspartate(D-aspartate) O-methyltransferase